MFFLYFPIQFYQTGHDAPEKVWWLLLIISTNTCHTVLTALFLILSIISTAFAVCIPKKIHRIFPVSGLSLRVNNVAFVYWSGLQAWWISFLIVYFWKPFSRVYPLQPFPYVRRQLICLFSTEPSVGNYWYIWSRLPHIWPSHSWVPAAYEYSPSDVYLYWKPWTRCVRWTIYRLSVCCLTLEAFFFLFLL